jgi:pyruvate/2-oxoglutarate dehydrogenase complex dihydrolipoamide dehydrogenase (E3) component
MNKCDFDVVVIGGGAGGFTAAKTAVGFGKKTAIIERKKLGGECTHTGCIPSKALIKVAKIAKHIKDCKNFGLSLEGQNNLHTTKVMEHVRKVVDEVYQTHTPEIFESMGIKIFMGNPRFIDNHSVEIAEQKITAKKFILCTGSSPKVPNLDGLEKVNYLTNETIFNMEKIPDSMTIIGGGPIAIEMCQAFQRLGCKVTVLVRSKILPKEDVELVEILKNKLTFERINFIFGMQIVKFYNQENGSITTEIKTKDGKIENITSDTLFVATGRKPNLEGLNLENAKVMYNDKGVQVNNFLQTTAENIYACGDIVAPYQFSHISEYEAVKAVMNALLPIKQKPNYSNIIWVTFTDPEFAHLGMTLEQAKQIYGDKVKVGQFDYQNLDRARSDVSTIGTAKFIYLANGKLLGAHILGNRAGEIIHSAQILKTLNISFYNISKVIHAYPTYADITRQAGKKAYIEKLLANPIAKFMKSFKK